MSRSWDPRRLVSGISVRLLAFNVLLLFVPLVGLFSFDAYERTLLRAQEESMVQQGRLLAAALGGEGPIDAERAQAVLQRLQQRTTSRLRVLDAQALALADSSTLGPRLEPGEEPVAQEDGGLLYQIGAWPFRMLQRLRVPRQPPVIRDFYSPDRPFEGTEVQAALGGSYGSTTRVGGQAVLLYSAIPIRSSGDVVGVALVSQSTYEIQQDLDRVRLATFKVFLVSIAVAGLVSLLVAATIAVPLQRLRAEAATLLDRTGRLTGRFRASRRRDEIGDLTRTLRQLSDRLLEQQRFSDRFAADVSHEFKNPLASIRSATEILAEVDDAEQRDRFVGMVQRDVTRMERLLSTLREVTRIDAGVMEAAEAVDVAAMASALAEVWEARFPGRVEVCGDAEVRAAIEPERLAQVLENLVGNAVSFSPDGAKVVVRLQAGRQRARIEVEDEGPGVPREHRERVFDRFFSYRSADTPDVDGEAHSGLGLAIVRSIVTGHGGEVWVEDNEPRGARFVLELPVEPRPRSPDGDVSARW